MPCRGHRGLTCAVVFGPALFARVAAASPHSTLAFTAWHGDVLDDLDRGAVDLVFHGAAPARHLRTRQAQAR